MLQAIKRHNALAKRIRLRAKTHEPTFWLGLMCAAALHAALIFTLARSLPRQMGEPHADPDALSVDLVDAESLGMTAPPVREPRQAAAPPQASEVARAERPTPWHLDSEALGLFPPSDPGGATHGTSVPQQRSGPSLEWNLPDTPLVAPGRAASVGRPSNITRSGENDEFGRGVVRALRQTMPNSGGVAGRTTIRLILSASGNLVYLVLVGSSGNPRLDQSVVFAAKQSSFPLPPVGATLNDRTFLVTYVYR